MCDSYFTLTLLNIYYNETEYLHLVLENKEGRFHCYADEDDLLYEQRVLENRKRTLDVYTKPIIIYDKPNFNKPLCETKYKAIVEKFITEYDKKWDDITQIIKVEEKIEANKLKIVNGRYQIKK